MIRCFGQILVLFGHFISFLCHFQLPNCQIFCSKRIKQLPSKSYLGRTNKFTYIWHEAEKYFCDVLTWITETRLERPKVEKQRESESCVGELNLCFWGACIVGEKLCISGRNSFTILVSTINIRLTHQLAIVSIIIVQRIHYDLLSL